MALEAPLRSSTERPLPAFVQRSIPLTPDFTKRMSSPFETMCASYNAPVSSISSELQRPNSQSYMRRPSWSIPLPSPSDAVGPSPVNSNGTDFDEEASDSVEAENVLEAATAASAITAAAIAQPGRPVQRMSLSTDIPDHLRHQTQESNSVIHAPQEFAKWISGEAAANSEAKDPAVPSGAATAQSPTHASEARDGAPQPIIIPPLATPSRPTISTNIKPASRFDELDTPQAQVLTDILENGRVLTQTVKNLEKINEVRELDYGDSGLDTVGTVGSFFNGGVATLPQNQETMALRTALHECWTLCNTLANLSYIHRRRVFKSSNTPDAQERAWKTCWRLCQELYENREEDNETLHVRVSLDLCRDFCHALFDIRQRMDEASDSVLRVSFELSSHLYSAQDSRNLPFIFRERTLEFYITLCHRLMKQRGELSEESDSLLRTCWALAEVLFSLRQNRRDGKPLEEELLVSAVQACWDLCDIFRDGWSQEVRPDRTTPRPTTAGSFFTVDSELRPMSSPHQSLHSARSSIRSGGSGSRRGARQTPMVPPTPVTILDDTPMSPEAQSPQIPNILVLGQTRQQTWSSGASDLSGLSGYTRSSQRSRSTSATNSTEDPDLARIKILIVRAAMDRGFNRDMADPRAGFGALQSFVSKLPTGSFGSLPVRSTLLTKYKNLVISDKIFARPSLLPPAGKKVTGVEVSKSILWLAHYNPRLAFLRDLFHLVFGFPMEEAHSHEEQVVIGV